MDVLILLQTFVSSARVELPLTVTKTIEASAAQTLGNSLEVALVGLYLSLLKSLGQKQQGQRKIIRDLRMLRSRIFELAMQWYHAMQVQQNSHPLSADKQILLKASKPNPQGVSLHLKFMSSRLML